MSGRHVLVLLALSTALAAPLSACERAGSQPRIDTALVVVGAQLTVRTDAIGLDAACQPGMRRVGDRLVSDVPIECVGKAPDPARSATFVLVHADNGDSEDVNATLGGVLVDADGHEVGQLKPASLRIPAHGRRTFALVDADLQARPTATDARIDVRAATRAEHPETVRITDGEIATIGGQIVASGTIENLTDRPARAVIVAGFQDKDGRPITRPFAVYDLGPYIKKPAVFTGPPGTATGYIFVAQVEF